jgi:hypothetical protein
MTILYPIFDALSMEVMSIITIKGRNFIIGFIVGVAYNTLILMRELLWIKLNPC